MGSNRAPGMWLEYVLIIVLLIIVGIILYRLLGPYLRNEFAEFCLQNNLPCR